MSWYALPFWIELGFKALKSPGWKWDKARRTDPTRISHHWLMLSVATLLTLAYGTRVEDACDRGIALGNLRAPPKALAPNHRDSWSRPARTVSMIRLGIDWLRRLMLKGPPVEPDLAALRSLTGTQNGLADYPSGAPLKAHTYRSKRGGRQGRPQKAARSAAVLAADIGHGAAKLLVISAPASRPVQGERATGGTVAD